MKHLLGAWEPFSTRTARQIGQRKGGRLEQGLGFLGLTPAPSYVTRTAEQQRAVEAGRRYVPSPLEKKRQQDGRPGR